MIERIQALSRRAFVRSGSRAAAGAVAGALMAPTLLEALESEVDHGLRFGLVTYQWGRDWDLPTLLRNCHRSGARGVELRVEHAHRVEPDLLPRDRTEVRLRFDNSPTQLIGLGTNWAFHYLEPERLRREIEGARAHLQLSHDVGGGGVKVKPNGLPRGVPAERTVEQIARSLNELGRFAGELGQELRVEVHGAETQELPVMKQIFDQVDQPSVRVCWNSNAADLQGEGLEHNFRLVRDRFGATVHVRELDSADYPYQQLMDLLLATRYRGWILMEASTDPRDRVQALTAQRAVFDRMIGQGVTSVRTT